jgi:hypothetical protein
MSCFANAAGESLFMHTWSLAVEEQYYIVILCGSVGYPASIKVQLLYIDDDHIGMQSARLYIEKWFNQKAGHSK